MHVLFGEERRGDCLDSLESCVCVCVSVCVCLMQCMVLGSQVTPRSLSVRLSVWKANGPRSGAEAL